MSQYRLPKLAELIAGRLREDILTGRLKEGDVLASQETLFQEYQVSPPALREAMRILETDGLITVRRGKTGGAVVHVPTPQRAAEMIAMVLQTRATSPSDVSVALRHLEPICAGLCADRGDRADAVVPVLRAVVEAQGRALEDTEYYLLHSREFHRNLVALCGNESLIVVIGALEAIWSAHESLVWAMIADGSDVEADPSSPLARATRKAALQAHEKLVDAIEAGDITKATRVAASHVEAAHSNTLRSADDRTILASLVSGVAGPTASASPAR